MDSLDYWRLCEELTVVQAAYLIAGLDPSDGASYVENWDPHKRPPGYEATKTAVSGALLHGTLDGRIVPQYECDREGNILWEISNSVDVEKSVVFVESLRKWLSSRGFSSGFFFPDGNSSAEYLDPLHPRYAPKLAAAVRAWEATADPELLNGRSPKQALAKWLREHAAEFGLSDEEGKPNETGIDEVSKVANWQPKGGVPKTPG